MNDRRREPTSGTTARVPRVLVVDDEPHIAEALRLLLSDEFEVTATTDPAAALLRLATGDRYDFILCDVMMPGLDGVEMRNRVHAFDPQLAARIVLVTGGILDPRVAALVDSVPNACIEKPIDLLALEDLIRRRTGVAGALSPAARRS